ncbi:hypothetical protein HPB47_023892 [Ixodes persulcatus]|uniref:Uncharacterized protein n=1 Tax=Ixodes persulcatus TaxID=34615 RepID=A0AC60Q5R7_IXOPE|nr:hypothetical protein HPB47_023892 [Ixodes persulcatus]
MNAPRGRWRRAPLEQYLWQSQQPAVRAPGSSVAELPLRSWNDSGIIPDFCDPGMEWEWNGGNVEGKEARLGFAVPTQTSYTCDSSRARCFSDSSHLCRPSQVAIHEVGSQPPRAYASARLWGPQLQVAADAPADRVPYPFRAYTLTKMKSANPGVNTQPDAVYCEGCGGLVVMEQRHIHSINQSTQGVPGVRAVLARVH